MSILGFNFAFGARDDGFGSALSRAGLGLEGVAHQVDSLADKVSTGNFFDALNTMQLSKIGDQLADLNNQSGQLETSLEGTFRNMSAEIRPALAQLDMTNKEFAKAQSEITSTAYGLNVGAGEVADAFRAIRRSGSEAKDVLSKMGIGLKELTLITKATGIETEEFTGLVRSLAAYGFTSQDSARFLDGFTNMAKGLGIADIAFASLGDTIDTLDDTLAGNTSFMKKSKKEQQAYVEEQLLGVQKLTAAFMAVSKSPQEAQQKALQFFKTINSERKGIDGMSIGLGDMGEMFKSLAQEAGFTNVEKLFGNISGDPMEALQQVIAMQDQLSEAGDVASLARFNTKLQEMLGGLSFVGGAGGGFAQRLADINKSASTAGDGLVAMAKKAHTANLSVDDALQRAKDGFDAYMKRLGGVTDSQFLQSQKKMYSMVQKQAKEMASNETWGPLFKQFVSARRMGVEAFFLPMKRNSEQLKSQLNGIGEAVGKGGLLGRFKAIQTLGIQGFFLELNGTVMSNSDRLKDAEEAAQGYLAKMKAFGLTAETVKPALIALGGAFASLFVVTKVVSTLTPFVALLGKLTSVFAPLLTSFLPSLTAILTSPILVGASVVAGIVLLGEMFRRFGEMPAEAFEQMAKSIDGFTDFLGDIFDSIMSIDVIKMTDDFLDVLEVWVIGVYKGMAAFFSDADKWRPVGSALLRFGEKIAMVFLAALVKLGQVFSTIGSRLWSYAKPGFDYLLDTMNQYIVAPVNNIIDTVSSQFGRIYDAFVSPFKAIQKWFKTFSIASLFRRTILMPLANVMDAANNLFVGFANLILRPIEALVNKLSDIVKFFYDKMPAFVTKRLDKLGLGEFASDDFKADFQIKRDGGENFYADRVADEEREFQRKLAISIEQDEMTRRQDETNRQLGEVVSVLKSQRGSIPGAPGARGPGAVPTPLS